MIMTYWNYQQQKNISREYLKNFKNEKLKKRTNKFIDFFKDTTLPYFGY